LPNTTESITMRTFQTSTLIAAIAVAFCGIASAQTLPASIARVQMTDNELSCTQIFKEITQMDGVMAAAASGTAPAADSAGAQVANQVAGAVAQQAMGQVAARIPGLGGLFGGGGSGGGGLFGGGNAAPSTGGGFLGGLLGQVAQGAAQNAVAGQAQQAQGAQQAQAAQQAQIAALSGQAAARKEHLTGVFLSKGCKMSDVQR
jgi:hypothetical protein